MQRRELIALLGGAASAWPLRAHAQQGGRVRRIGWLTAGLGTANLGQLRLNAFKRGLADLGWIEGRNPDDIAHSIDTLASAPNGGLFVRAGGATVLHREVILALAARHRLPAVYSIRNFVHNGGLASYGADDLDTCRRAAAYADRIL